MLCLRILSRITKKTLLLFFNYDLTKDSGHGMQFRTIVPLTFFASISARSGNPITFTKTIKNMNSLQANVSLNFEQLLEVVKQLSPSEKLKLNDVIWNENIDIPIEHQKLVADRIRKSKANPARMLDWDEASKTLTP